MTKYHWWAVVAGVLSVCGCLCALLLSVRATVVCLPKQVDGYARSILTDVHETRTGLQEKVDALSGKADAQLTGLRKDALSAIRELRTDAKSELGSTRELIASESDAWRKDITATVNNTATGIRADLKPVLTNATALIKDGQDSLDDLYPDLKAGVESFTVASTSVAHASLDFRGAIPKTLEKWDHILTNSDRSTDATATFLGNLATMTKPLPAWARIGLAVAPPVVQVGFTAASWMALKGKSK